MLFGWIIARARDIDVQPIAVVLIFIISPIVAFGATAQLAFKGIFVFLPLFTLMISATIGLACFGLGRKFLQQKDLAYLLPIVTGGGNNGYFGLPLAVAVFAPEQIGVYFLIMLGVTMFESTMGYYFIARGELSVAAAVKRAAKMPTIYAILAGLGFATLNIPLNDGFIKLHDAARGAYICMGMIIIGMALARHRRLSWNVDFLALGVFGKYILWTLAVCGFIWLDNHVLMLYDVEIHKMMMILALTPAAANAAAYAAETGFKPQHAATIVFFTTAISFAFVPFVLPALFSVLR